MANGRLSFSFGHLIPTPVHMPVLPLRTRVAVTLFGSAMRTMLPFAAVVLGGLLSAATAEAASFDCAQAKSRLEVLICSDAELSSLDGQMGQMYSLVRSGLPSGSNDAASLLTEQRAFLKNRTNECYVPVNPAPSGADTKRAVACLKSVYTRRLAELRDRLGCSAFDSQTREVRVNGFSVKVKPICVGPNDQAEACGPRPEGVGKADGCGVVVTSPQGKIVYEDDAPYLGIDIDPITGRDMGNGEPVAVLNVSEGADISSESCEIISLGKKPGLIGELDGGPDFEDLRGNGQVEILTHLRFHSVPAGPSPLVILQVKGSKFQDVSSEFWPVVEKDIRDLRGELNRRLQEIHSSPNQLLGDREHVTDDYVAAIIQDYLFAGKYAEAKRALTELWPPDAQLPAEVGRERTWQNIVSDYCSARAELHLESGPLCSGQ